MSAVSEWDPAWRDCTFLDWLESNEARVGVGAFGCWYVLTRKGEWKAPSLRAAIGTAMASQRNGGGNVGESR